MMNNRIKLILNPFQKIAGWKALIWGIIGLLITVLLCNINALHFNGLGQIAIREKSAGFLPLFLEHLIIWFIPVVLFYLAGRMLSSSNIRFIDVAGTFLFAQLPYMVVSLCAFIPPLREMMAITEFTSETAQNPLLIKGTFFLFLFIPFLIGSVIWIFQAYKTCCNIKGTKLVVSFIVLIILSDFLCRIATFELMKVNFLN